MVHLSKKALAFSVAGAFGAVAAAYAIGSHEPQNEARVTCVSQILIPETVEQADFIKKHAAALYDNAYKESTLEQRMSLVFTDVAEKLAAGKTVTLKAVPDTGETTLPDQSKRKSECFQITAI